jgi:post-segregation antitoxin (ccd killing protein)
MSHKPRTPEELARERAGKKAYTLYLDIASMEQLKSMAKDAGISVSEIANEAITSYVRSIKKK